jgi:hypothetical protein
MIVSRLQEAVRFIVSGSYQEAFHVLDETLVNLNSYFQAQQDKLNETDLVGESLPSPTVEAILGPYCIAQCGEVFHQSEYPMYGRAMLIQGVDDASAWASEVNVAVLAAVVLYNKGLICHILGQGSTKISGAEHYNTRARVMYEKAFNLVNTCNPSIESNFWLKLVLLNNLGQLFSYICDRSSEQLCLSNLDMLLTHKQIQDARSCEEMELKLNVMLLLGVHRPAPAA